MVISDEMCEAILAWQEQVADRDDADLENDPNNTDNETD